MLRTSSRATSRRHVLAATSALAAMLVLYACGGGESTDSSELTDTVPEEDTTLTVWSFLPGNYEGGEAAYDKVIAAFEEKYPQVTIELRNMPYPTYFDSVRNATVARKGPDVITMYGGAQAYSYRNGLVPMQDAMEPDVEEDLKFVDDNYSQDGNLYILPVGTYGYAMMINQDKFQEAGLDPAEGLADWESLLETCRELSDQGIQPIASGWKDGFLFETFMYMMSSQLMDDETLKKWTQGEIPVDDEIFTTATGFILDMNEAGCFGGEDALGRSMFDDSFNQYYAGETAMMVTGSLSTAEQAYKAVPSTTVMGLPQVPGSHYDDLIDAGAEAGWAVTKWTESPEAAGAFVNFMASADAQQILWDTVGVPPNLKSVSVEGTTPSQKDFLPLIENEENHTGFAAFPLTVLAVYERNAAPLISGSMSAEEFTEQAQSAFEQSR